MNCILRANCGGHWMIASQVYVVVFRSFCPNKDYNNNNDGVTYLERIPRKGMALGGRWHS